jgi:hypothetical protein
MIFKNKRIYLILKFYLKKKTDQRDRENNEIINEVKRRNFFIIKIEEIAQVFVFHINTRKCHLNTKKKERETIGYKVKLLHLCY